MRGGDDETILIVRDAQQLIHLVRLFLGDSRRLERSRVGLTIHRLGALVAAHGDHAGQGADDGGLFTGGQQVGEVAGGETQCLRLGYHAIFTHRQIALVELALNR